MWETTAVFLSSVGTDIAFVLWARAAAAGKLWPVILWAGLIQIFATGALLLVVNSPILLLASAAGHSTGSGLGVILSRSGGKDE